MDRFDRMVRGIFAGYKWGAGMYHPLSKNSVGAFWGEGVDIICTT